MNNTAMNTFLLGCTYMSRTAAYRVCQTVFQNHCPNLYSHKHSRIPAAPLSQKLVLSAYKI